MIMEKLSRNITLQIEYCTFFSIFYYIIFMPLNCYCSEPAKTITITKEAIQNATPTKAPVELSQKDLRMIEMLEKRHFPRSYPEFDDAQRLKNLEFELLGRVWEYTSAQDRIRRLKLASSNTMLAGVALPASISSKRNVKRMRNDSIQLRKRDDVGLIDGFLRLISPEKYEYYRKYSDRMFEYEY